MSNKFIEIKRDCTFRDVIDFIRIDDIKKVKIISKRFKDSTTPESKYMLNDFDNSYQIKYFIDDGKKPCENFETNDYEEITETFETLDEFNARVGKLRVVLSITEYIINTEYTKSQGDLS